MKVSQQGFHLSGLMNFCKSVGGVTSQVMLSKSVKVWAYPSVAPFSIKNHVGCERSIKNAMTCGVDSKAVKDASKKPTTCVGT